MNHKNREDLNRKPILDTRERSRNYLSSQDFLSESTMVRALARAFVDGPLSDGERLRHTQFTLRGLGMGKMEEQG